jgi:hypothetical protein
MLELVPKVDGIGPNAPAARPSIRTAPLFYLDSAGKVHRRKKLTDTSDYEYTPGTPLLRGCVGVWSLSAGRRGDRRVARWVC